MVVWSQFWKWPKFQSSLSQILFLPKTVFGFTHYIISTASPTECALTQTKKEPMAKNVLLIIKEAKKNYNDERGQLPRLKYFTSSGGFMIILYGSQD